MKVIIPAAGRGMRLRPFTDKIPKCLININGKPLLFHLLSGLNTLYVEEVIIVVGYRGNMIKQYIAKTSNLPKIDFIVNHDYEYSNSIVSISLTREHWKTPFCIIDSDLLIKQYLLRALISGTNTCLFVDSSKPLDSIDMRVQAKNDQFLYMDKALPVENTVGEFFGISRWMPEEAKVLSSIIGQFVDKQNVGVWYEYAIREVPKHCILPIEKCSSEMWREIDNPADYRKAIKFARHLKDKQNF